MEAHLAPSGHSLPFYILETAQIQKCLHTQLPLLARRQPTILETAQIQKCLHGATPEFRHQKAGSEQVLEGASRAAAKRLDLDHIDTSVSGDPPNGSGATHIPSSTIRIPLK